MSGVIEYAQQVEAIGDETQRFREERTLRKRLAELEAQGAK
jgi:hypothetical protein